MCEITDNAVKELQAENVLAKELDHGGFKKKKRRRSVIKNNGYLS